MGGGCGRAARCQGWFGSVGGGLVADRWCGVGLPTPVVLLPRRRRVRRGIPQARQPRARQPLAPGFPLARPVAARATDKTAAGAPGTAAAGRRRRWHADGGNGDRCWPSRRSAPPAGKGHRRHATGGNSLTGRGPRSRSRTAPPEPTPGGGGGRRRASPAGGGRFAGGHGRSDRHRPARPTPTREISPRRS